jgi:hypothetical protein
MPYRKKEMFYVSWKEKWAGGHVNSTGQFVKATNQTNAKRIVKKQAVPSHVVKVYNLKAKLKKIS